MVNGGWRGTRGASFVLVAACLGALFGGGAPAAHACDPSKEIRVAIAPTKVNVPVGGTATLTTITNCRTDDGDWTDDSELSVGGTIQFDIRLVDADTVSDDVLVSYTYRKQVNRPFASFAWPMKIISHMQISCPSEDEEIIGPVEKSGEGQPDEDDPADLGMEVDHGDTVLNTNHYANNAQGEAIPAECVPVDEEEVSWTTGARDAFSTAGGVMTEICYEVAILPASQNLNNIPECDYVPTNAFGEFRSPDWPPVIEGLPHQQYVEAFGRMPRMLWVNTEFNHETVPFRQNRNAIGTQQAAPYTLTVTGDAPFVDVTGQVQADGSFTLNGVGTVAGYPNISVRMTGTFTAGGLEADYSMGAGGELPGGYPIVYRYETRGVDWDDFWARMAQFLEDAAEAIAALNFEAPLGGVDFSTATINIAGQLLVAAEALRTPEDDPESFDLPEWVEEALDTIEVELAELADQVAASTLVSRVQTEIDLRTAALRFGEASVLRQQINTQADGAPTQTLSDTINQWMYALAQAGLALQAVSVSALGSPWATVSAASYLGPEVAPDSIVSGFGSDLALATEAATTTPLPTTLSNTSIRVTDSQGAERLAGLFFSSSGQFNFHIPSGTALGPAVLTLFSGEQVVATGRVIVRNVQPGLFSAAVTGAGVAAALSLHVAADGTQTQAAVFDPATLASTPISLGAEGDEVYLLLFGTGIRGHTVEVTATVGGLDVPVLAAVAQGQFVGLDQVNIGPLPRSLAGRSDVDIILTVDGEVTNTVTVRIQ